MFKRRVCLAAVIVALGWCGSTGFGQGNLIQDGEFDGTFGDSWGIYGAVGFTAGVVQDAMLSGYNAALIDVTDAAATTGIGIAQSVQFEQGQTVKIGLTARASQAREIVILMQLYTPAPLWADIFMVRVPLTTEAQTFVYEYTYTGETTSAHEGWSVDVYYMLKGQSWAMNGSNLNCKVWLDRIYIGEEPPVQHRACASAPDPADGAAVDRTWYALQWIPGEFAASHQVYFSDNLDDVNEATVAAVATTRPFMAAGAGLIYPQGLTPGTTYYWRVDEVNDANPDSPWRGQVWSFQVRPRAAWQPSPAHGAEFVKPDQDLFWEPGVGAASHTVYIGEGFDEVNDAVTGGQEVAANTCDPGILDADTTYFWRVDTFDGGAWHRGPVWSFTTVPEVAVTDPDLAGWWTLDEGKGTTAVDWSGRGGHGTLVGGPQWADGIYGGALLFAGAQYVDCGTTAEITGDFTLAAWVKMAPANAGKYMGIVGRLTQTNGLYYGFGLVRHSAGVLRSWVGDGTADLAKSGVSSDTAYTDTEWHHVAMVHQGQANRLFVDGGQQSGTSNVTLVPSREFFHIGRQYSHLDDRYFEGLIDDVRVYKKAMTQAQVREVLAGDPLVASGPAPGVGETVDVRDADVLGWSGGAGAVSHDVYLGTDRTAVAAADKTSPEFKGNQPGTTFSLAGLVAFGGGDTYWRIDEVDAGGLVHKGYVWRFTVPAFLIVDDFESYDDQCHRVYYAWKSGASNGANPACGAEAYPGNGTGSVVGNDPPGPYAEQTVIHGGSQSMPLAYDNAESPFYSEASRSWLTGQDWTAHGATTLVLYVRGQTGNDATQSLYVALANQGSATAVVNLGTAALTSTEWTEYKIPLSQFAGVNPAAVKTMTVGVGDRASPKSGNQGIVYVDDIILTKP